MTVCFPQETVSGWIQMGKKAGEELKGRGIQGQEMIIRMFYMKRMDFH